MASKRDMDKVTKDLSDVCLDSAPKAWGQPDTAHKLGIAKASTTGSNPLQNSNPLPGRGRPQAMAPPQKVSQNSSRSSARPCSQLVKNDQPGAVAEEDSEDDDGYDSLFDGDVESDADVDSDEVPEISPLNNDSLRSRLKKSKKKKAFKSFFNRLETDIQLQCPACHGGQGATRLYPGIYPLAIHAKMKRNTKTLKYHRALAKLLEEEWEKRATYIAPPGESFEWVGIEKNPIERQIVWPPMVVIWNTKLTQGEDGMWIGVGSEELLGYFKSYSPLKARYGYGPQGHMGISLLIFDKSAVGYVDAERLHIHLKEQGTGRSEWDKRGKLFVGLGGKRQLYGCLATMDDLETFNSQSFPRIEYEMRPYNEVVLSQLRQMREASKGLCKLKKEAAQQQTKIDALGESISLLRKIEEVCEEKSHQEERKKGDAMSLHASSAEDGSIHRLHHSAT